MKWPARQANLIVCVVRAPPPPLIANEFARDPSVWSPLPLTCCHCFRHRTTPHCKFDLASVSMRTNALLPFSVQIAVCPHRFVDISQCDLHPSARFFTSRLITPTTMDQHRQPGPSRRPSQSPSPDDTGKKRDRSKDIARQKEKRKKMTEQERAKANLARRASYSSASSEEHEALLSGKNPSDLSDFTRPFSSH